MEKNIIHGDSEPSHLDKTIFNEHIIRMVDFSSGQMADDSGLSPWSTGSPTLESAATSRGQNRGLSFLCDGYFALVVFIWAIFAGEWSVTGLCSPSE